MASEYCESASQSSRSLYKLIKELLPQINARGGKAITVKCDHGIDTEVYALFDRIRKDEGHLDLLVNNAFQGCVKLSFLTKSFPTFTDKSVLTKLNIR